MLTAYFQKLKLLWLHPSEFFEQTGYEMDFKDAGRFALWTGFLVALEIGVSEAFSGGAKGIVALVTLLMLVAMPLVVMLWVYLWAGFIKLCGLLLGQDLPTELLRQVVAYSTGGWVVVIVGYGFGKWLALLTFVFQFFGVEKGFRCSRWAAAVYVGLPFSIVAVIFGMVTLMFMVFK